MRVVRRVGGCVLGLLALPLAVATAVSGYFVEDRLTTGRWLGALGWVVATVILLVISLAVTVNARVLLGREDPTEASSDQGDRRGARG